MSPGSLSALAESHSSPPARPQELDLVFYRTLSRKVRKDSTISIGGSFWEVPAPYIGQRIQIRHPEGKPQQLYLFEENQPVARLRAGFWIGKSHRRLWDDRRRFYVVASKDLLAWMNGEP